MKTYFRYLIRWITHHQLLGLTAGLLLVIIGFEGVAGLGLPALFWCREIPGLLFIGFAVAVFFALCSFVGFLLDHDDFAMPAHPAALHHYFVRTIWLPTGIVAIRGVWRNFVSESSCGMEWLMLAGYAIGLAFVYYGAGYLAHVANPLAARPWFLTLVNWMASRYNPNAPPNLWLHSYAAMVAVILAGIYIAFNVALMFTNPWLNAGVAITTLLGLIVLLYGALRFFTPHALPLILLVMVVWVSIVNQIPRKHQYDELKSVPTVDLTSKPRGASLISDEKALIAWRDHLAKTCGETRPKLIVLMTSGGGVRASVWTAAVLRELDLDRRCGYLKHIRVIGGASGGMVGAGYWVTRRVFPEGQEDSADELRGVTADALDNVARYLVLRDVPALFLPLRIRDRGYALEQAWKKNAPAMEHKFSDLREHEKAGTAPSLIYTPASLDDGRRVLISNLDLGYMTSHAIDGHEATRSAFQFFEVFGDKELTVATAARMSASFPYVSSAAELPTKQLRRLGDAGYFDNFGGFVISSWLAANRKWLVDNTSGVLIVQVRDSLVGDDNRDIASVPRKKNGKPKYPYLARASSELAAPIQGVASTRTKAMHFRTDFELATVAPLFGDKFVETIEIELDQREVKAPLSWNLTRDVATGIIEYAKTEVRDEMEKISEWWTTPRVGCPAAPCPPILENQNATTPTATGRTRASSSPP